MADLFDELRTRGLLHQCTDEAALREHLRTPRRVYAGFDPTADSLTVGNLVPIMLLKHFQRAGHTPVVVMGGGTGLIGDPSGKEAERQLRTHEEIERNIAGQRAIFERVLDFTGENPAGIVNNLDWLAPLGYIEALRDIGKHFSVNMMMQKESIRERLHNREQGISYTEFSYMILQAYDFLRLYEDRGVTVQVGGSDQWGNIVAGSDLIRRMFALRASSASEGTRQCALMGEMPVPPEKSVPKDPNRTARGSGEPCDHEAHGSESRATTEPRQSEPVAAFGLTAPLVTKSDGGKFGKTESGAVWLSPERTSPFVFYQFWLNAADDDVERYLKLFTLLEMDEIATITSIIGDRPEAREAQRALAEHVTRLIHGKDGLARAEAATNALFSGDVSSLDEATIAEVFAGVPTTDHAKADLEGEGMALVDLLPLTSLAHSKREAREHLTNGAIAVNTARVGPNGRLNTTNLLHNSIALIRRGKKHWHVTRWR